MKKLILITCLFVPLRLFGSQQDSTRFLRSLLDFPLHFEWGAGADFSTYRDFATSPMVYYGALFVAPASFIIADQEKEMKLTTRNSIGVYEIFYGEESTSSTGYLNNFRYTQLHQIKRWSTERWNLKAGGVYDLTTIFRLNYALQNNAAGYEIFSTLSGSFKVTRDLSRLQHRIMKIFWLPLHFKPRQKELSLQLDLGIMNSTYRNGYAYIGQELLLNSLVIFDDYEFDLFSGYRIGSRIEYTYFLKNRNAFRVSYIWDAYFSGADLPKLEMSHHLLQFTMLFKLK